MKIAITGGAGFIGSHLTKAYLDAGHDVLSEGIPVVQESTPLCPKMPHNISKLAGEWYVRYYTGQYGLAHTILRYADVYGETDSTSAHPPLTYFVRMLRQGQPPIIRG